MRAIFAPWFVTRFREEDYLAFRLAREEDYLAFRLASRVPTEPLPGSAAARPGVHAPGRLNRPGGDQTLSGRAAGVRLRPPAVNLKLY